MKKVIIMSVFVLVVLAGCGSAGSGGDGTNSLDLWTFQAAHEEFYQEMATRWNENNPEEQIELNISVLPYEDLHNKLLVCSSSGKGCPDIADIEVKRFPLFIEGDNVPFYDMTSYVEESEDEFVTSRLEMYGKDGKYYGIPFHVGADVMYYNEDLMKQAGVDTTQIKTWSDYVEAAYTVTEKTGIPMTVVETQENIEVWGPLAQAGADITNEDGTPNINDSVAIDMYTQIQQMIEGGVIIVAPGGFIHAEDFYGFMNNGGTASLPMPLWYLNRFTDYMPDLKGKVSVRPFPINENNPNVTTVGVGGTGTVVMTSSDQVELAARFLSYAKLSQEGNILEWEMLGFDPINVSVWDQLETPAEYQEYFVNDPLEILNQYDPNTIISTRSLPVTVDIINELSTTTYYQIFEEKADVKESVDASQEALS